MAIVIQSQLTREAADLVREQRGYASFEAWAAEVQNGIQFWRSSFAPLKTRESKKDCEKMAESLETEYRRYIEPFV